MTHLVNAEIDGVPFARSTSSRPSEIMGLMLVLFLGGVERPPGWIGTLFRLLAENPDQRAILREDPSLIPDAVEEASGSPPHCSSLAARPRARSPFTA